MLGFLSGLFWWGIGYIIHKLNNVNVPESNSGRRHAVSQLTRAGIPLCTLLRLPRIPPSPGAYWLLYWRRGLICSFPVLLQGEQGLWGEGRSLLLCGNRLHVACRLSRGLAGCLRSTVPPLFYDNQIIFFLFLIYFSSRFQFCQILILNYHY